VGTTSLTWRALRVFLCCYDNPHDKDEMEQRLENWKWAKTIPETLASFNEKVHIWTQEAQQTVALDFARQVAMPTQHVILERRMPRSSTGNIHVLTTIPHDRETHVSTLKMTEAILVDEAEHVDAAAPVAFGYGDVSALLPLGLHFLGQQLPRGPKGEFECLLCGDAHWYRKCNVPASLEELTGQHAVT
jgi:hypothetical protein